MDDRRQRGMKHIATAAVIAATAAAAPLAAQHQQAFRPWIHTVQTVGDHENSAAVAMVRTEITGRLVGMGASCEATKPIVTVWLEQAGGNRTDRLEVKGADGRVSRFEGAKTTERGDGRFVARLSRRDDAERFLDAALEPGAEITNGNWGFINGLRADAAAALTAEVHRCGRRPQRAEQGIGNERHRRR